MINVLHIDDNKWFVDSLTYMLKHYGINITASTDNLTSTLDILISKKFDFIIVDLNLNGIEWEGIKIIKKVVNMTDAIIIVVSGNQLDRNKIYDCYQAGASAYIYKPSHETIPYIINQLHKGIYVPAFYACAVKEKQLTESEKIIINEFDENLTISQIAKKNHKSYDSIRSIKKRIKNKVGPLKTFLKMLKNSVSQK